MNCQKNIHPGKFNGHYLMIAAVLALLSFGCQRQANQESASLKKSVSGTTANWQLFLDDYWIAESKGIKPVLHQPHKYPGNPLIKGDSPWAQNPYCFGTVIYDKEDTVFKIWYQSYNYGAPVAERTPILYATSTDGVHWEQPDLGLFEFRSSKNNNIVMQNYGHHDLYSPSAIKDMTEPDPEKRYKMIWWDFPLGEQEYQDDGMCVAFSPDGIRWKKYEGNPVLHAEKKELSISDVMAVIKDIHTGKYVAYTKGWAAPWPSHRQIVRTESRDFIHWSTPEVVITHKHDVDDPQSYGMSVSQYGNLFIGMLHSYKNPGDETIDVQLAVSHDSRHWERVAGMQTFIPLGDPDSWDSGMIFTAPLLNHGDSTLIYYSAWDGAHNLKNRRSGIGLATLRLNGFVSLDAKKGYVITHPVKNAEGPLLVNVNAAGGSLRAALLDADGKAIPGYAMEDCIPVEADEIYGYVRWKNKDTLPEREQPLRIKFQLENASLYGFYAGAGAVRFNIDFTNDLPENADIEAIARHLMKVENEGCYTKALAEHFPNLSKEKAYEIQMKMLSLFEARGERLAGWKMGGGNIDDFNPGFGFMLASDGHKSGDIIDTRKFVEGCPLIEAEVGFVIGKDLSGPVITKEELINAIDSVGGYSELINIRTKDREGGNKASPAQSIADRMSHGGFVYPLQNRAVNDVDLNDVTAEVLINGEVQATGKSGKIAFFDEILYLANTLPKYGRHLRAGDIIITGSLLTPPPAQSSDSIEIRFSSFGSLKMKFR